MNWVVRSTAIANHPEDDMRPDRVNNVEYMPSERSVADRIVALRKRLGTPAFVAVCVDLMAGADRTLYVEELRELTGHAWAPGDSVFDPSSWGDYWVRTWGARGLLHAWDDTASEAVVNGLSDPHWRPAEMCLKVVARHETAEAGDGAARLLLHELARVRMQALRALAAVGDTEHIEAVEALLADESADVRKQARATREQMRRRLDR